VSVQAAIRIPRSVQRASQTHNTSHQSPLTNQQLYEAEEGLWSFTWRS
jgi:hypothetical protein